MNLSPEPHDRLTQAQRIRTTRDFQQCYDSGLRAGDNHLLVFVLPNGLEHSRVGVSVSKKHGNAVKRNRKKRLLREAFRLLQHELPSGVDFVLVPRQRSDSGLADYQASLIRLAAKLERRMQSDSGAAS